MQPEQASSAAGLLDGSVIDESIRSTASPAVADVARQPWGGRVLLGISVVLIAFNLRPVFSSLSVLLPEIVAATGLSAGGASLLTTLPVVCLGLFAPMAPGLAQRFGLERVLFACLLMIVAGSAARGMGSAGGLFVASAVAGVGIAISNVLLSGLVKRDFAKQSALMMGLYTMAVCGGAAAAAAFTVPLEHVLHAGWTGALALWAWPAAIVALIWLPQAWPKRLAEAASSARSTGVWRDRLAWQVTCFMGLQSALAYIVMGWLAPMLRERGLAASVAGYVLSVSVLTQVVTCLVVPAIAVRLKHQVGLAVLLATLAVGAFFACLFGPLDGLAGIRGFSSIWTWAVLLGVAQGGLFALALTMIVLRSPDARTAARLSGMAQGVGYLIAALGPLLVGLLHGWTGSFVAAGWLFLAIGIGLVAAGLGAGRARTIGAR